MPHRRLNPNELNAIGSGYTQENPYSAPFGGTSQYQGVNERFPVEAIENLTPEELQAFLRAIAPQRPGDSIRDPRFSQQEMIPHSPNLRDRMEMFATDAFGNDPAGRRRQGTFMDTAEVLDPGFMLVGDSRRAFGEGDTLGGVVQGGAAALGIIPGLGPVAKGAGKAARRSKAVKQPLDRVKLGKEYPEIGTPVWKTDKRTGNRFEGKGDSAEGLLLKEEFGEINPDIEAGNYTPYYPVAERSYVDPSNYDIRGNTLTDKLPKKQETADRFLETFGTPEVRGNLNRAYDAGLSPDAQDWYAMQQLEQSFIDELGELEGRRLFRQRFADSMAATTGGADPGSNLRMSSYLNYMRNKGRPFPYVTEGLGSPHIPYPIGAGEFGAKGNVLMYDKVINQGQGLTPFGQPKRFNFSANFMGDRSRATIDKQMMTLFGKNVDSPPGDSYGVLERILGEEAANRGVMPANFQDVGWAGAKGIEGKPMIQFVNESIERTARVTGKTPEEVVRDSLINANSPLYSLLAGVGFGGSALSQRQSQQTQSGI